ncbi:MAG: hypothetical protein JW806_09015 [Sedimentisphaerales bacterium]|nr:hypothetical protein [Sedimentisphaerales bacterium]
MKRLFIFLTVLLIANVATAGPSDPVVFNDANLKAAVEAELSLTDPTEAEMLNLTGLDADALGIADLTGLDYATNLGYLSLRDNNIVDISQLAVLVDLRKLYLSRNDDISDINAISNLTNLSELGLTDVGLSTITPLADVNQIRYLWISYNFIEDISPLTNYQNLDGCNFYYNPLSFDSWCTHLKTILDNNPVAGIGSSVLLDDYQINTDDLDIFASKWLRQDCSWDNGDCGGPDMDESGAVDFMDFAIIANWWLYED